MPEEPATETAVHPHDLRIGDKIVFHYTDEDLETDITGKYRGQGKNLIDVEDE